MSRRAIDQPSDGRGDLIAEQGAGRVSGGKQ